MKFISNMLNKFRKKGIEVKEISLERYILKSIAVIKAQNSYRDKKIIQPYYIITNKKKY